MAWNRVAPLKQLRIPRLELQASSVVNQELTVNIQGIIFWNNSKSVLQ